MIKLEDFCQKYIFYDSTKSTSMNILSFATKHLQGLGFGTDGTPAQVKICQDRQSFECFVCGLGQGIGPVLQGEDGGASFSHCFEAVIELGMFDNTLRFGGRYAVALL